MAQEMGRIVRLERFTPIDLFGYDPPATGGCTTTISAISALGSPAARSSQAAWRSARAAWARPPPWRTACRKPDPPAADVHLKERRKLILVPRETPLHLVQLRNLVACAEAGAVVLPAMPAFYTKPKTLDDMLDLSWGGCATNSASNTGC